MPRPDINHITGSALRGITEALGMKLCQAVSCAMRETTGKLYCGLLFLTMGPQLLDLSVRIGSVGGTSGEEYPAQDYFRSSEKKKKP